MGGTGVATVRCAYRSTSWVSYDPAVPPKDHAPVTVELDRPVAGGVVLGHDASGRVVLADGGLPGETVVVVPRRVRPKLITGVVSSVEVASPGRTSPPCALVARGCGGCDLQHATRDLQREMRIEVVRDALAHTGSLPASLVGSVPVEHAKESPPLAGRTTMRLAVTEEGRLGLRRRRSHDVLPVPGCLVAHPLLLATLDEGRFTGAREVVLRGSVHTGEVLAMVTPRVGRSVVPDGVVTVGADELRRGRQVWITEQVDGHDLRISPRSFFQPGPHGAAVLARCVQRALGDFDPDADRLVDLYGGVGLFTVLLGARNAEVVERSASAAADARVNTASLAAAVTEVDVEAWRPSPAAAVVADPAREGLGATGVAAVVATGARNVALVSCDPAAMARDVSLLFKEGYMPARIELVDLFPHTHHIEAVTTLRLRGAHR